MKVKFEKLNKDAVIPSYAHKGDAGMDLHAAEGMYIPSGEWRVVRTGLRMELPDGYEAQVRPRSGLAAEWGITVLNSPGTIDAGYRGEIGVILHNASKECFVVLKGMRIAQLVVAPVVYAETEEGEIDCSSARGTGGFGSTGV